MNRSTAVSFVTFVKRLGVKLTPAQDVYCRIAFDGAQVEELDEDGQALAKQIFGDIDVIPIAAQHVIAMVKGARVGGTWLHSLALLWKGLTLRLDSMAPGERAFGPIVAPDMRLAKQALRYIRGAVREDAELRRLVVSEKAESLALRRPHDGREIEFAALPASRGGSASRGRTLFGALIDEACLFYDRDSGVVNDSEVFRSVVPRVRKGGQVYVVSTAYLSSGLLYDLKQKNFGNPTTAIAAVLPTELARPDDELLMQVVRDERERDPFNAAREFDCQWLGSGAAAFFDHQAINDAMKERPIALPPRADCIVGVGADFAFKSDSSAIVVVQFDGTCYRVAEVMELRPRVGQPLKPSTVVGEFAKVANRHHSAWMMADAWYFEAVKEALGSAGLPVGLWPAPAGQTGKRDVFTLTKSLLHEGRLELSAKHTRLAQQLREVVARPTQGGGLSITSPRRSGSHGDLISALTLAVHAARTINRQPVRDLANLPIN